MSQLPADHKISTAELVRTFGHIGLISFGGPAGQIALMHRVLVEEKAWLDEKQFLHALNFCMLLPGPEAMQLATYSGWLMRGVRGGLIAGGLFVLPGFVILVALSAIYAFYGEVPVVEGLLFGLKAAVLAIVVQALARVWQRALNSWQKGVVAIAAFFALAVLRAPFPVVIAMAAGIGFLAPDAFADEGAEEEVSVGAPPNPWRHIGAVLFAALLFWVLPVVLLIGLPDVPKIYGEEAVFFSITAMVTFGGAYAVLAFVGQQAVEVYHWLRPDEMLAGLGLAETTPGPLILVLVFVGFLAAFREAGVIDPLLSGVFGAFVTVWVTFVPCFVWIFLGAPFIEQLRGNQKLNAAFSAITAAVVGVIANLSLWFGLHVLFGEVGEREFGVVTLWWPQLPSVNWMALLITLLAGVMVWRGYGLFAVLGVSAAIGFAAIGLT